MSDKTETMATNETEPVSPPIEEEIARERIYIDGDEAHFERVDITNVDVNLFDGRRFEHLEPRRLFPRTGLERYITLLDDDGNEVAVIRNLASLPAEERRVIEMCLDEYYHVPHITKITGSLEKFGVIKFFCETDRGDCTIEVRNIVHQIKLMYGIRVMFLDNDDNRYEIPDIRKLDRKSMSYLNDYL